MDVNARIYPFKVHQGKQPYDKVHNAMLVPLLSGKDGYWSTLDWNRALSKGQESVDIPFSGQFDFVDTTYVFPITHMVAPKENVVSCTECHTSKGSRLANLGGFYMPRPGQGQMAGYSGLDHHYRCFGPVSFSMASGRFFANGRKGTR